MSFLKKIAEIARKQNDEMSIGGIGGDDGASGPREDIRPLEPPFRIPPPVRDNRIMSDQGIGGYLNPNQINQFVNPPSPNNAAGQRNMADLLQQQADTFGGMLTYAPPPSDETPPSDDNTGGTGGGGTGGGGTGGGGTGGGGTGGGTDDEVRRDILDEIRRRRDRLPPFDIPMVPPRDLPPFDIPGLPPMVPPIDLPLDRDLIDYGYGPGIMPPLPPFDISGIGSLPVAPPMRDVPPVVPPRDIPPPRPPFVPPRNITDIDMPRIDDMVNVPPPMAPPIAPPITLPRGNDGIGSISIDDLPRYDERVTLPSVDFLTGGLPSVNLPRSLPVPRMPSGMETLVSPEILMGRGRGRLR